MKPRCENLHHFALFVLATTERAPPIPLASIPYRCHIVTFDRAQPPRECALIVAISHLSGIWPKFYSPKHLSVKSPWWTRQLVIFFPQFFFPRRHVLFLALTHYFCGFCPATNGLSSSKRKRMDVMGCHPKGSLSISFILRSLISPKQIVFPSHGRPCDVVLGGKSSSTHRWWKIMHRCFVKSKGEFVQCCISVAG